MIANKLNLKQNSELLDWNAMYEEDDLDMYDECVLACKEFYDSNIKKKYRSLKECVDFAIKEGNHAAFAKLYLDINQSGKNERFLYILDEYKENYKEMVGKKLVYSKLQIIGDRKHLWRNPDFEYTEANLKGNCLSNAVFSAWEKGDNLPQRDALIQLGFYLLLDSASVNKLLRACGHQQLYVLDIVDVICRFYLDKFAGNTEIPAFEKLKITKDKINQGIKKMMELDPDICVADKDLSYSVNKLEYVPGEGWNIEKEISSLRDGMQGANSKLANQDFLTATYSNIYHGLNTEEDLDRFLFEGAGPFALFRYGLLLQTSSYVTDFTSYRKNLVFTQYPLEAEYIPDFDEVADLSFDGSYAYKNPNDIKADANEDYHVQSLNLIQNMTNPLEIDEFMQEDKTHNMGASVIKNILHGEDRGSKNIYTYRLKEKKELVRLAISAGREDEIFDYLRVSGYWDAEAERLADNLDEIDESNLDEIDLIIIYAVAYKKALVKKWVEAWYKEDKRDKKMSELIANKNFPFLRLIATINRDILQVLSSMIYSLEDDSDEAFDELLDKLANIKNNTMLFPFKGSQRLWFERIEPVFYDDRTRNSEY